MSARGTVRTRSLLRLLAVAGLVGGAVLLGGPAFAHASLVGSTPADGATVTSAPTEVQLRFSENIRTPSAIVVTGPGGRVSHGAVRVVDNTVSIDVALEPTPADVGHYDFAYRVVSADGHPVADQLGFDYRPPGVQAAKAPVAAAPSEVTSTSHTTVWLVGGAVVVVLVAAALLGGFRRGRPGRGR